MPAAQVAVVIGRPAALPALLVLLASCATHWSGEYDGYLPHTHPPPGRPDGGRAVFVVDGCTGAPLSEVQVRLLRADFRPQAVLSSLVAEITTNEHGLAWLPWEEKHRGREWVWVFDKPGYAPHEEREFEELESEVIELRPGHTIQGQILTADGQAAAGIQVEYFPGVHTLRRAVTDSQGRFTLVDVAPDTGFLWAVVPGAKAVVRECSLGPQADLTLEPIRFERGVIAHGRTVDADGRPVAGAVVYSSQSYRGPRTTTGRDGEFILAGLAANAEIGVSPPDLRLEMVRYVAGPGDPETAPAAPTMNIVRIRPRGRLEDYMSYFPHVAHLILSEFRRAARHVGRSRAAA